MNQRPRWDRARRIGRATAVLLAAGLAGWLVAVALPGAARAPAYAEGDGWPPSISVERVMEGEREVGDVVIDGQVVYRLRGSTGEYSAYERAVVVAERLKLNMKPRDEMVVSSGLREGSNVVLLNDTVLLTPLPDDLPADVSMREGAETLAERLAGALDLQYAPREVAEPWSPAEPYEDKIVPIISFGKGARIGGARVNGPANAVRETQAVAQIEARLLKYFEVQVYVPVSTAVPGKTIDRVPGVAVTGVADLRVGG